VINLAAAAAAEDFGALAVGRPHPLRGVELARSLDALRSLLGALRQAGAATGPLKIGKTSLQLHVKGRQQTLVLQD
jgi:hypothetical protein